MSFTTSGISGFDTRIVVRAVDSSFYTASEMDTFEVTTFQSNENIVPDTNNQNLGSATTKWKDMHLGGIAYIQNFSSNGQPMTINAPNLFIKENVFVNGTFQSNNDAVFIDSVTVSGVLFAQEDINVTKNSVFMGNVNSRAHTTLNTLFVNGNTTMNEFLTVNKNMTVLQNTLLVDKLQVNGDVTMLQNLLVLDNGKFQGSLTVCEDATFVLNVYATKNMIVDHNLFVVGRMEICEDATVSGNSLFHGPSIFGNSISVGTNITVNDSTSILGNLSVTKNVSVSGDVSVTKNIGVTGTLGYKLPIVTLDSNGSTSLATSQSGSMLVLNDNTHSVRLVMLPTVSASDAGTHYKLITTTQLTGGKYYAVNGRGKTIQGGLFGTDNNSQLHITTTNAYVVTNCYAGEMQDLVWTGYMWVVRGSVFNTLNVTSA